MYEIGLTCACGNTTVHLRKERLIKREALIRKLRQEARRAGIEFTVITNRGKGSHCRVRYGTRRTIIQSGELKPNRVKDIWKQLGLD